MLLLAGAMLAAAAAAGAGSGEDEGEDTFVWPADDLVMPLSLSNFDHNVGNGSAWMLEFYAPWCKHCQALQPVLESSARRLLGELDAEDHVCFGKVCTRGGCIWPPRHAP